MPGRDRSVEADRLFLFCVSREALREKKRLERALKSFLCQAVMKVFEKNTDTCLKTGGHCSRYISNVICTVVTFLKSYCSANQIVWIVHPKLNFHLFATHRCVDGGSGGMFTST